MPPPCIVDAAPLARPPRERRAPGKYRRNTRYPVTFVTIRGDPARHPRGRRGLDVCRTPARASTVSTFVAARARPPWSRRPPKPRPRLNIVNIRRGARATVPVPTSTATPPTPQHSQHSRVRTPHAVPLDQPENGGERQPGVTTRLRPVLSRAARSVRSPPALSRIGRGVTPRCAPPPVPRARRAAGARAAPRSGRHRDR